MLIIPEPEVNAAQYEAAVPTIYIFCMQTTEKLAVIDQSGLCDTVCRTTSNLPSKSRLRRMVRDVQ